MTPRRVILFSFVALLVVAGVAFAVFDVSAADQAASVASFLLAAILAGGVLVGRRPGSQGTNDDTPSASDTSRGRTQIAFGNENVFMGDKLCIWLRKTMKRRR